MTARFNSSNHHDHSRRIPRSFLLAGLLSLLTLPLLAGCGSLNAYRSESVLLQSQLTTIENYSTSEINRREIDQLLIQVAEILGVRLDPAVPKPRIVVTSPDRIARLFSASSVAFHGHARAAALYFPRASLIMIPYFDRTILGHELAHYITDHYLNTPRAEWEGIAQTVEWKLLTSKPVSTGTLADSDVPPSKLHVTEVAAPPFGP